MFGMLGSVVREASLDFPTSGLIMTRLRQMEFDAVTFETDKMFAQLKLVRDPEFPEKRHLYLKRIVVDEQNRGHGIGSKFLMELESLATNIGASSITVEQLLPNTPAPYLRGMLQRRGYLPFVEDRERSMIKEFEPLGLSVVG